MALNQYDWIFALITIAFCVSAFGNGANDVANSYATSVAARTLTMVQVGFMAVVTEFFGAVVLGSRVTSTIKNSIISIDRFKGRPGVLILAMACAETGSATWLIIATRLGFPVSTTQSVVGALIGVGFAANAPVKWAWKTGSVSQVAASWVVSPLIAAGFAALLFLTLKYMVLERRDPLKWALRMIPFYLSFTAAILALFIIIEAPKAPSLEEFGAGKATGIILGVFFGMLLISYGFFLPYLHRRLIKNDARLRWYHLPLGPTLWKDDPYVYYPARADGNVVIDYYEKAHAVSTASTTPTDPSRTPDVDAPTKEHLATDPSALEKGPNTRLPPPHMKIHVEPEVRFLASTRHLPIYHPSRLLALGKYFLLQGVTRDCVSHNSERLAKTHALAVHYDNKVEHVWTYAQVASAIMMSIAHGSNDVANAVGPWSAAYSTWKAGEVATRSPTPVWMLVVAGLLLGTGFWFFGYHIIRSLGNRVTQLSPTRGFSMELGAAITVLLASRLGLPVSTTQCLAGALVGVALMNFNVGAVNWKQVLFIFSGWVLTLPVAGLIAGLLMAMALNTPHF